MLENDRMAGPKLIDRNLKCVRDPMQGDPGPVRQHPHPRPNWSKLELMEAQASVPLGLLICLQY